jgi:hypothetical protein
MFVEITKDLEYIINLVDKATLGEFNPILKEVLLLKCYKTASRPLQRNVS